MQLWYSTRNNQFWLRNPVSNTGYFVAENVANDTPEVVLYFSVQGYWDKLLEGLGWTDEGEFECSRFIFESNEIDEVLTQLTRLKGYL